MATNSGIPSNSAPYADDTYQKAVEDAVKGYNDAYSQKLLHIENKNDALDTANAMAKSGNLDGAMVVVMLAVFMYILEETQDEQNKQAYGEKVASAFDAMTVHIQDLVNAGATSDGKDPSKGMTYDQAKMLYEEQADAWYDLNNTDSDNPDGTKGNLLYMLDPVSKQQLADSITDFMSQFNIKTDPDGNFPDIQPENDPNVTKIYQTINDWWNQQGNSGNPIPTGLRQLTNDTNQEGNTCNAQVQSFNGLYQANVSQYNAYVGSENSFMASYIDQDQTMVSNLKG